MCPDGRAKGFDSGHASPMPLIGWVFRNNDHHKSSNGPPPSDVWNVSEPPEINRSPCGMWTVEDAASPEEVGLENSRESRGDHLPGIGQES
mmetsp:Transcript_36623/g.87404  ORF Transcript_36623/g.87404 Transcript_36623/m.87404 type:complete len:91 (-) Transcript_36623:2128-2400(-)